MSIAINSNFERDQLIASFTGQTVFTYSFPIFDETYLSVFKCHDGETPNQFTQQLTLGVDYSVQGVGEEAGGTITLTVGAIINDVITLVGTEPIERESVFQDLNPFTVALNQQLNEQTVMAQQTYTYWNHITPRYNMDQLVSNAVRPLKRILPMLPDGHVWVGRGEIGDNPDDIVTAPFASFNQTPIIREITQTGHGLNAADWVRINGAGLYVKALATDPVSAEIAGLVIDVIDANHFVLQVVGYVETGVFTGLTSGGVYFLSDVALGTMTLNIPVINGEVNLPLFIAETATTGWVRQSRGVIIGGQPPLTPGGESEDTSIQTITQIGHNFDAGDWLYISANNVYSKGIATSLAASQVVGVVINVIDANTFRLQQSGFIEGVVTHDDAAAPIASSTIYYLSATVAGQLVDTAPAAVGQFRKPLYVQQTLSTNAGWILEQLPTEVLAPPGADTSVQTVTQALHGFAIGDWLYVSADATYALGDASAEPSSQVVGVVTDVPTVNSFVIQQSGTISGVVTQDEDLNPIVSATVYYLSATTPGQLVDTPPAVAGQYTKPLYTQNILASNTGWIMEQRPLIVVGAGGAGSIIQLQYTNYRGTATIAVVPSAAVAIPQLNTAITLGTPGNLVKISVSISHYSNFGTCHVFSLTRNGVVIPGSINSGAGSYDLGTFFTTINTGGTALAFFGTTSNFTFVDAPGNVGPYTYGLIVDGFGAGNLILNQAPAGGPAAVYGISSMILEEFG